MAATQDVHPSPWYLRGRSIIIGAGGLAAALLAVLGLWDRLNPPGVVDQEDFATFSSATLTKRMTLSHFAEASSGINMPLIPESGPAKGGGVGTLNSSRVALLAVDVDASTPTPTNAETSPTSTTPTETVTTADTVTPTDTATVVPSATLELRDLSQVDDLARSVVDAKPLDGYDLPPKVVPQLALSLAGGTEDPSGGPLSAHELAKRLADALKQVDANHKAGKKDPRGWIVAANLEVRGLERVPLLLTWSLDGLNVPVNWTVDNLAYRLTATTAHDGASVEVWVPNLKKRGVYNVNLALSVESTGSVLARSQPVKIVNGDRKD